MPDDIGGIAVFLASKAGAFISGQTIVADGGIVVLFADGLLVVLLLVVDSLLDPSANLIVVGLCQLLVMSNHGLRKFGGTGRGVRLRLRDFTGGFGLAFATIVACGGGRRSGSCWLGASSSGSVTKVP